MPGDQNKVVQIPNFGNVQFPASMSDSDIEAAIQKNYAPKINRPPITMNGPSGDELQVPNEQVSDYVKKGYSSGPAPHPLRDLDQATGKVIRSGAEDLWNTGKSAVHALVDPPKTPGEKLSMVAGPGGVFLKRMLQGQYDSSAEMQDKASQAADQGNTPKSMLYSVAAGVPLVGPLVNGVYEKAEAGDTPSAVGTGLSRILQAASMAPESSPIPNPAMGAAKAGLKAVKTAKSAVASAPAKVLSAGPDVMNKSPLPQQTGAGNATNADIADYAASKGIDLTPAQASGSRPLQAIQAVGERGLVGNSKLLNQLETNKANFANLVDDYRGRVGNPATTDPEMVGAHLQEQATNKMNALKQSAQNDFQSFTRKTGDIPVDLSNVKAKYADKLAAQSEALKNLPAKYSSPIRNTLGKLANIEGGGTVTDPKLIADFEKAAADYGLGPGQMEQLRAKMGLPSKVNQGQVGMSTAQQMRSAYLDMARDYSGNIPKPVQKLAAEAAADIDGAMEKAANKAGATETWRKANAKYKQLQQTFNSSDSPISKIVGESDPQKITSSLLQKGQYGGNTAVLKYLKQNGFDVSPLKSQVVQDIADGNFKLSQGGRGLGGYSTDFLKSLFEPAELSELQNMGQIARKIKFEMNPSGTSNVTSAEHQLGAMARLSAKAPLVPAAAARFSTSPALMRIIRGSSISPQATAAPQLNAAPVPPAFLQILRGSAAQNRQP